MIKNITVLSLFFLNFTMVYSMGSKLRALGSKLPLVSALAAAQFYKEYDDRNEAFKKGPIKYVVEDGQGIFAYPSVIRKPLYSSASEISTDYIEGRVHDRLNGKISPDLNVHVLRSNGEQITTQKKDVWFPSLLSGIAVPMRSGAYATPSIEGNDTFVGIPSYEESKFVIEHEISHIERAFFAKFTDWYRQNGQLLHIPLAIDACLIVAGLRKTVALGAIALAHSFHEQMSNLITRYVEQDADDHVPDTKEFLEDGIKRFQKSFLRNKVFYKDDLLNKKKENVFLSLCQLLDQFPLCEDKEWGYALWSIIEFDPHHPPMNIRIEKLQKRLDKLNEIKEEEIEDLWMVD